MNRTLVFAVAIVFVFIGSLAPFVTTNAPEQIGYLGTSLCSAAAFAITTATLYYVFFIKKRK